MEPRPGSALIGPMRTVSRPMPVLRQLDGSASALGNPGAGTGIENGEATSAQVANRAMRTGPRSDTKRNWVLSRESAGPRSASGSLTSSRRLNPRTDQQHSPVSHAGSPTRGSRTTRTTRAPCARVGDRRQRSSRSGRGITEPRVRPHLTLSPRIHGRPSVDARRCIDAQGCIDARGCIDDGVVDATARRREGRCCED
jgi:hypothetical protein